MGLRQFRALVRKDMVSELHTRETVVSMFLFVVLAMVVFHYAFTVPGGGELSFFTGGMLWVVFVFGALLGLNRSFAHEKDEGCLDGLLLCPVDRVTIFFAKMTANLIFLGLIQVLAVPVFALFFASGHIVSQLPVFLALVVLADLGIAALGTLLATIAMNTHARDLLLPIVFLPLVIPLLIAAASGTSAVLTGGAGFAALLGRLVFLLVYDGVFLVLAYGTYEAAIGE
ncbi:MAG: heme exporter protein CcmB [Thermoleophilia bacterium]